MLRATTHGCVSPLPAWTTFRKTLVKQMLKSDPFQSDLSTCLNTLLPTGQSWGLPRETPKEGSVFLEAPVTHRLPTGEQTGRILQRANYR